MANEENIYIKTIMFVLLGLLIVSIPCMVFKPQEGNRDLPLKEEHERQLQQTIQKYEVKFEELKYMVEQLRKRDVDREVTEGVRVLTALKDSVVRNQVELIETIKENQRTMEKLAEGFISEMEPVNSELKRIRSKVELLSSTLLKEVITEGVKKEMLRLLAMGELRRVQQYAVNVTLDPDTAHPALVLSDDGKQVVNVGFKNNLPNNPERFDLCGIVLGNQSFSSGKFYYEVQVKGKTEWDLGVVRESINRKGQILLDPEDGYWVIMLRNEKRLEAADGLTVSLTSKPEKVGVFVDYEEGLVSFYDVGAAALIYSFTDCTFNEKLYPFFGPSNSDRVPLIITPVNYY